MVPKCQGLQVDGLQLIRVLQLLGSLQLCFVYTLPTIFHYVIPTMPVVMSTMCALYVYYVLIPTMSVLRLLCTHTYNICTMFITYSYPQCLCYAYYVLVLKMSVLCLLRLYYAYYVYTIHTMRAFICFMLASVMNTYIIRFMLTAIVLCLLGMCLLCLH